MATAAAPADTNDLVMSAEEIQSELNDDTQSEEVSEESAQDESDERSPWEDGDEGDETEGTENEESQAKKPATSVRTVKADGKTYQVDTKDVAKLDRILSLGLVAPRLHSEIAKLKKENVGLKTGAEKSSKYEKLWANLEASKHDHDALYEKIFNKPFVKTYEERKAYEGASDEEKKLIDSQRRAEAIEAKVRAAEERAAKVEKDAEEKSNQAEVREYKSRLTTSFRKYEFSSKVEDEVKAEKLNRMLWRNVVANLKADYGEKDDIPQDVIEREFKDASELLGGTIQDQAKKEVKKITEEKKKTSKAQAQAAASRNYSNSDVEKISKETDPVKLFDKMFGRRQR